MQRVSRCVGRCTSGYSNSFYYKLASCFGTERYTHADGMVDVSGKNKTNRMASASCRVKVPVRICSAVFGSSADLLNNKGNILETAKLAGVMAAKQTASMIPLCHHILLNVVRVDITRLDDSNIRIQSVVRTDAQTGVEMEALTAVSLSALTLYDMTKSALKGTTDEITITDIRLDSKLGGSFDVISDR